MSYFFVTILVTSLPPLPSSVSLPDALPLRYGAALPYRGGSTGRFLGFGPQNRHILLKDWWFTALSVADLRSRIMASQRKKTFTVVIVWKKQTVPPSTTTTNHKHNPKVVCWCK